MSSPGKGYTTDSSGTNSQVCSPLFLCYDTKYTIYAYVLGKRQTIINITLTTAKLGQPLLLSRLRLQRV